MMRSFPLKVWGLLPFSQSRNTSPTQASVGIENCAPKPGGLAAKNAEAHVKRKRELKGRQFPYSEQCNTGLLEGPPGYRQEDPLPGGKGF